MEKCSLSNKKGWRNVHYLIKSKHTSLLYIWICYLSKILSNVNNHNKAKAQNLYSQRQLFAQYILRINSQKVSIWRATLMRKRKQPCARDRPVHRILARGGKILLSPSGCSPTWNCFVQKVN